MSILNDRVLDEAPEQRLAELVDFLLPEICNNLIPNFKGRPDDFSDKALKVKAEARAAALINRANIFP